MILICEQCERGIEIPRNADIVTCSCGAKYWVDTEALTYDRIVSHSVHADIEAELKRAAEKYEPEFSDIMQALGVITAEYTELANEIIRHSPPERVREEAVQVAAMSEKLASIWTGRREVKDD